MRKSVLQLYAPFIALAVVQALLVVSAPSRGPNRTAGAGGASVASGSAAPVGGGESAAGVPGSSTAVPGATTGGVTPSGAGPAAAGSSPSAAGGTGTASVAPGAAVAKGDTSHCVNGRQFALPHLHYTPPCVAKFSGNNGGATYQGVT